MPADVLDSRDPLDPEAVEVVWRRLRAGDRRTLARAISWCESSRRDDRRLAQALVVRAAADDAAERAVRVGITGPAGVGKSTFLDVLGDHLIAVGRRPAVLAVDPSSRRTGGSLLGDQARMTRLLRRGAFVRPSPTRGHLGGAGAQTLEAALLCAAAGFDPILIETVGVGQNETEVSDLVDAVVLLLQPGAGDELQGMKRGLLEHADLWAVSQADGERLSLAQETKARFEGALRLLRGTEAPPIGLLSALEERGVQELWAAVEAWLEAQRARGEFDERRRRQRVAWFQRSLLSQLLERLESGTDFGTRAAEFEGRVASGELSAPEAVNALLDGLPW
jgi:LAO/AO transport system kinase